MSYNNRNAAYDLSLFESTAVPLEKEPEKKKSNNQKAKNNVVKITNEQIYIIRKRRHNPLKLAVGVVFGAVVTFVIATIIQGQVQLTELSKEIASANKELSIQQSIYTEMQMKANATLSPSVIDEYAVNKLIRIGSCHKSTDLFLDKGEIGFGQIFFPVICTCGTHIHKFSEGICKSFRG